MPYASRAQQRKFHAMENRGEIAPETVKEFDSATNFKDLPDKVGTGLKKPGPPPPPGKRKLPLKR